MGRKTYNDRIARAEYLGHYERADDLRRERDQTYANKLNKLCRQATTALSTANHQQAGTALWALIEAATKIKNGIDNTR